MDWNLAIERNSEALKRILAMLVAMAGLDEAAAFTSPLWGGRRSSDRRVGVIAASQPPPDASRRPPHKGEVKPALTLPRHLHRAILRLLRPAESAVRRLIIVMARGLVVTLPPPRPRKAKPGSIFVGTSGGTGIYLPPGVQAPWSPLRDRDATSAAPSLPLLDPRKSFRSRPRRPVQSSVPRISFPGYVAPSPITPRLPPAPDDLLDATRLTLRLAALGAALEDLPGQAKRFARWKARKKAGRTSRNWPLRPGRAPGQLKAKSRRQEVHEVLSDLHWLAFEVLDKPDTS